MRATLKGKVVNVMDGSFKSKSGDEWHTKTYQFMTTYKGQPFELENIQIMERAPIATDERLGAAWRNQANIEVLVNIVADSRAEGSGMRCRLVDVQLAEEPKGKQEPAKQLAGAAQ